MVLINIIWWQFNALWWHVVVSKIFRTDAVKIIKFTIRPIGPHRPGSSSLPHVDTGPTVSSIFGMLPGTPFLSECQVVSFFRQNPLGCPTTNSHLLSNVVNGPTSILMDELLNSCNSFRSCAACGSPCVLVIVNWCATSLEPDMPLKHLHTT
jgi:hypothetical protein